MADNKKVWLVSGCSTGIGREIALAALRAGHKVVVTARNEKALDDIVASYPGTALALKLDVTRQEDVDTVVKETIAHWGAIEVLVNNAGYGYLAAIEEGEDEQVRAMFETNFFGALAMIKAVLPGMRQRRSGNIINISSQAGLMSNPGTGYYSATKYAMEAMSEALGKELAPFNIKVSAVQPGPFRTDWSGRSMQQTKNDIADYYEHVGSRRQMITGMDGKQPGDPRKVGEAVLQLVASDNPPTQLLLGNIVLDAYREKLEGVLSSLDEWEAVTRDADFPS